MALSAMVSGWSLVCAPVASIGRTWEVVSLVVRSCERITPARRVWVSASL